MGVFHPMPSGNRPQAILFIFTAVWFKQVTHFFIFLKCLFYQFIYFEEKNEERDTKRKKETSIFCSSYLGIQWLILILCPCPDKRLKLDFGI